MKINKKIELSSWSQFFEGERTGFCDSGSSDDGKFFKESKEKKEKNSSGK